MTQDEMDSDLVMAQSYLSCTRLTVDRCRHESVTETSLWIFDGSDKYGRRQIGSVTRLDALFTRGGETLKWSSATLHN